MMLVIKSPGLNKSFNLAHFARAYAWGQWKRALWCTA